MTIRFQTLALLALASLTLGCDGDPTAETDSPTDTDVATETDTDVVEDPSIEGEWVSDGDDVSPLLQAFMFARIDAEFNGDGTYEVVSTDDAGSNLTFTGTYTVDISTVPQTIVLQQASPSVVTSEGIWMVEDGVLTYEVTQTSPDQGFTPPTVAAGFGSTMGPGVQPDANIQIFR